MLRNVHDMNYADIEKGINALGEKAKHNQVRFYVSSDKKFKEMKQQSQLFSFFIATLLHPICSTSLGYPALPGMIQNRY